MEFRQRFYCLVKQDLFEALLRKRYVDFKKHDSSDLSSPFFQNDVDVFRQPPGVLHHHLSDCSQLFVHAFFLFHWMRVQQF